MIPILFDSDTTAFTTNGLGRLSDAVSCVVTEERNGLYELEMSYPMDGALYAEIQHSRIIGVVPCEGGTLQAFRIYKVTRPLNGIIKVLAEHLSYQLAYLPVEPFTAGNCAAALAGMSTHAMETCPFTFWTDKETVADYKQEQPDSIKTRLGGVEGSVLDVYGGEYEWDNWTVKLHASRGADRGATLRYGKNIIDLEQEENIASTYTSIVGVWESDGVVVFSDVVDSSYASAYPFKRVAVVDFSADFDEKPTKAQLATLAASYMVENNYGIPTVSVKVSFVALWQTEEYVSIAPLEQVKLCDTVSVYFEKLGISTSAKVVKTRYDVLLERYESIEIGAVRSNFAKTMAEVQQQQQAEIAGAVETAKQQSQWLTNSDGYVMAIRDQDGTWKELVFSSVPNPYAANAQLLRINNNGIGFTSGGLNSQNYRNAWTLDGHMSLGGVNNERGYLTIYGTGNAVLATLNASGLDFAAGANAVINIRSAENSRRIATFNSDLISIDDENGNSTSINAEGIIAPAGDFAELTGNKTVSGTTTFDEVADFNYRVRMYRAVWMPAVYDNALSGTTRALRVKSDGELGYTSSSRKIKQDISEHLGTDRNPHGLYDVPVVQFRYKADPDGPLHIGFIAEDMEECFPVAALLDGNGDPCGWDSESVLAGAVRLIQEQKKLIDALSVRVKALEDKINADTVL